MIASNVGAWTQAWQASGWFSKSTALSARVSFLSPQPLPALLLGPFFIVVFDSCSSFFAPKQHRNACFPGYVQQSPCWNIGTIRRVGWAAFTKTYSRGKWVISHLPPTFAITIHIPHVPVFDFHASLYLTSSVPIPHVPASHTWCSQVLRLASLILVPTQAFQRPRPLVPVPLLYTAQ